MLNTLWLDTAYTKKDYPSLQENATCEVCVIGGGLSGIVTAYLLAKSGKNVLLLEGRKILSGATGHTTAKLTTQHELVYATLIKKFGEEAARTYYDVNNEAIQFGRSIAKADELYDASSVLFAQTKHGEESLRNEWRAYQQLKIPGTLGEDTELPLPSIQSALTLPDQAQIHPVRLGQNIAQKAVEAGAKIYEDTRVQMLNFKENKVVLANGAHVFYKELILCTHYPVESIRGLQMLKLSIDRSYVVSGQTTQTLKGQYLSVDKPSMSVRTAQIDGKSYLVLGGESHEAGKKSETQPYYDALYENASKLFGVSQINHNWSAQDPQTPDDVPYAGQISSGLPNVFLATGFRKWGMTNSIVSAQILNDLITNKPNKAISLYSPKRSNFGDLLLQAMKLGGMVASEFVSGKINRRENPKCTHMGCQTRWNEADETWDCPCHGSRFRKDGSVLEGPATRALDLS